MSEYSLNGVYRCENFAQHLAENTFPTVQIGTVGGIDGWYIVLRLYVIDNQTFVYPFIHCYDKPRVKIHSFFNISPNYGQSIFRAFGDTVVGKGLGPHGKDMNILDILNQKNGYLVNGTLSIEYGIHVDAIQGVDGIWKFNLNDKLFNPNDNLTIKYMDSEDGSSKVLYGHRQILRSNSPLFRNQVTNLISRGTEKLLIEECLQIAHGVRIPLNRSSLKIASIAHDNKLRNVVQYADQQLVQEDWCPKTTSSNILLLESCIEFGLRHYLAHLVNHFECLEDLKKVIKELDYEKMSGEAMKTFMTKMFELKTSKY